MAKGTSAAATPASEGGAPGNFLGACRARLEAAAHPTTPFSALAFLSQPCTSLLYNAAIKVIRVPYCI